MRGHVGSLQIENGWYEAESLNIFKLLELLTHMLEEESEAIKHDCRAYLIPYVR